jgi:hypothetical protein
MRNPANSPEANTKVGQQYLARLAFPMEKPELLSGQEHRS